MSKKSPPQRGKQPRGSLACPPPCAVSALWGSCWKLGSLTWKRASLSIQVMARDPLLAAQEIDFGCNSVVKGKQQTRFLFSFKSNTHVVIFRSLSCVDSATPLTAARQAPLSSSISQNSLKFMSVESVMPSNHLILCCPLRPLPSIFRSVSLFQWVQCDPLHGW